MTHQQRVELARAWHDRHVAAAADSAELDTLRARLAESTATLRTVANMFSNSVWAILPARIKAYFAEYRG